MIARIDRLLGKGMAIFAVVLMTLLVVQAPIATVDGILHTAGYGHAANAFAGALVDLTGHDKDHHDGHDGEDASANVQADDDGGPMPDTPAPHHHHQSDHASVYGLAGAPSLPMAWATSPHVFGLENDLRHGIGAPLQERPPKTLLVHVA
ncbi:hypothetical protein [Caulobacter sp. RHG1]|uniref:hypothetical protein n=1 Tax=Caulobacter sp. (strain RHG1) TaxID=2545762 RepID=UPI0015572A09|nr:hypothetical protein [Caulobacter sp. RHG1]NQE61326.1 hypothetical protein [Caulobacter sp. RHG1]